MKTKIFISYLNDPDNKKMQMLSDAINRIDYLSSVVIANRRDALIPLTSKVAKGINECEILIPILTQSSISSQWVNQEIGFASALERRIIPIVETAIINGLKGFIHKQVDLAYTYDSFPENKRKENIRFKKCVTILIDDLKLQYSNKKELFKLPESPKLYLLENGKLRYMPNRPTRILLGYTNENIVEVNQVKFDQFKLDRPIQSIKEVDLVEHGGESLRVI